MSADVFLKIMFILFVTCYLAEIIGVSALIGAFQATLDVCLFFSCPKVCPFHQPADIAIAQILQVGLVVPRHVNTVHLLETKLRSVTQVS